MKSLCCDKLLILLPDHTYMCSNCQKIEENIKTIMDKEDLKNEIIKLITIVDSELVGINIGIARILLSELVELVQREL